MNFAFSEEQEQLRSVLRRFLEDNSPPAEAFRWMETADGYDPALWKQMADQLGLQGLPIPEAYGGQGGTFLELVIALEELGRALLCAPYFSSVCLAAGAILAAGSEEQKRAHLPGIAAGETVATLALLDGGPEWEPSGVRLAYAREGDAYTLSGEKRFVTDAAAADLVVVAARRPGSEGDEGLALFCVRRDAEGVATTPVEPLDATRRVAHLELRGVRAELLGEEDAGPSLARTLDLACVALAAESLGGAQRCLDAAVAYARERVQFGRPIGSFQAIQHRCADVLLEVESARSAAYWAGWVAAEGGDDLPLAASVAKSICDDTYRLAAAENIHVHGGMGFTWEADAHLYFKRAQANAVLLGSPAFHRARIARLRGF